MANRMYHNVTSMVERATMFSDNLCSVTEFVTHCMPCREQPILRDTLLNNDIGSLHFSVVIVQTSS